MKKDDMLPGETVPDEAVPNETLPDEAVPNETLPDDEVAVIAKGRRFSIPTGSNPRPLKVAWAVSARTSHGLEYRPSHEAASGQGIPNRETKAKVYR